MPNSDLNNLVVAEARRWLGTPFAHLGRVIGRECDCLGLIVAPAHAMGLSAFDLRDYPPDPANIDMQTLLRENMDVVYKIVPGVVIHLKWFSAPRHLAIISPRDQSDGEFNMIHSYQPSGKVVEHIYDRKWQRRLLGIYQYRNKPLGTI